MVEGLGGCEEWGERVLIMERRLEVDRGKSQRWSGESGWVTASSLSSLARHSN